MYRINLRQSSHYLFDYSNFKIFSWFTIQSNLSGHYRHRRIERRIRFKKATTMTSPNLRVSIKDRQPFFIAGGGRGVWWRILGRITWFSGGGGTKGVSGIANRVKKGDNRKLTAYEGVGGGGRIVWISQNLKGDQINFVTHLKSCTIPSPTPRRWIGSGP